MNSEDPTIEDLDRVKVTVDGEEYTVVIMDFGAMELVRKILRTLRDLDSLKIRVSNPLLFGANQINFNRPT